MLVSVHKSRRMARWRERRVQAVLDALNEDGVVESSNQRIVNDAYAINAKGHKGVRVTKAGDFQWVLESTPQRGH